MSDDKKTDIDPNFIKLFDLKTPEKILERTFNQQSSSKNFHENILLTKNNFSSINELKSSLKDDNYYILENADSSCCSIFQKFIEGASDENTAYFDKSFRNSTYIDMFFNTIPNVVLGQLTPFLKVSFLFPDKIFTNKGVQTDINSMLSLQNYVGGIDENKLREFNNLFTIDFSNQNSVNSNSTLDGDFYFKQALPKDGKYFLTDESIYTSPPHLSPNFRPLMSISKLGVKVTPTKDFNISLDEYTLSLIIHDKKMLHKFKYLIGVEYRDMISAVIEYGWSYPDYGNENVYSHFFNRILRKKVYCKLVNLSYNFDEVGQVKLEMKLMTKGAEHLIVLNALENSNNDYSQATHEIERIKKALSRWLNTYKISPKIQDSILLSRLIDDSVDVITKKQSEKIDALIKTLENTKNANSNDLFLDEKAKTELKESIKKLKDQLYNTDTNQKVNKLKQSYNKFITDDVIKNFDNWVLEYRSKNNGYYSEAEKLKNIKTIGENYYFHEIITYFVNQIIIKKDDKIGVDEIQTIFYNFNKNLPPEAAGKSIAGFKINKNEFIKSLQTSNQKKLTLEHFIGFLLNNFLNKLESQGYKFVTYKDPYKADGTISSDIQKHNKEVMEKALKASEDNGIKIIQPRVSFRIENVNKIMRIHIYDVTNRIIFKANANEIEQLDHIKKMFNEWKNKKINKDEIQQSANEILVNNPNRKNFSYMKEIFGSHYPVITLDGAGSSVLKSFTISNSMDAATTSHLINKLYDNIKKNNITEENFYTRVVPGKITMESLGFPLAEIHQTFFVDANTGTDIDNLYNVTSISHNIEHGSFKTNYELANADSYGAHENIFVEIERIKNIVEGKQIESSNEPKKKIAKAPKSPSGASSSDTKNNEVDNKDKYNPFKESKNN